MGPNVIRLNFRNTAVTHSTLQIIKLCPRLRSLGLNGYLSDADLHDVATSCPYMAHLDLSRCYCLSDDGIERMAKNLNRLQSLKTPFFSELLSNLCFTFISWHCSNFLHTLYLSCAGNEFIASAVRSLLASCAQLHTLGIDGIFEDWVDIEDVFEPGTLNRLRTLIIVGEFFQDLSFIGEYGVNLEVLSIAGLYRYTSSSLMYLLQSCSKLRKLYVNLEHDHEDLSSSQLCTFADVAITMLKTAYPRLEIITKRSSDLEYDVMRM
eukprot:gene18108-20624_t